ncbi:MAG: hypothetical protein Q8R40_03535 [bacterium]|nr:hypothetical protein [bacterium]
MANRQAVTAAALVLLAAGIFILGSPETASGAVQDWQQGVTIFSRWDTDYSSDSFKESVRNAAGTGANYITLHITHYQPNVHSSDIQRGANTPTDQALQDAINYVHSQGLQVMVKLQVLAYDNTDPAFINPPDRDTWFRNYTALTTRYARIAQALGVAQLCIGTELISMSTRDGHPTNTQRWNDLIAQVRSVYSGKLTYSANWGTGFGDEKARIDFWPALDFIGISAYYNLRGDGSVSSLTASWNDWNSRDITPFQQKWGKPILFTEVGYRSIRDSYKNPWMWWQSSPLDIEQQARDYEALFQYWDRHSFMRGVHWWHWSSDPNAGGPDDTDYTPQRKPAQQVLAKWFGGNTSGGTPPPPPPPPPSPAPPAAFTTDAAATPSAPRVGEETVIAVKVTGTGGASSDNITDIEISNAAGRQGFQQYFANQDFSAGGTREHSIRWTPVSAGSYTLKAGVFSSDWRQNYYWGNEVLVLNVGASPASPPAPVPVAAGTIDIWWPADGSSISGIQPFKALLSDAAVDTYEMFWQVDNSHLNPMRTDHTDWPHKEALVDVSPWNWNGAGAYLVNFIARHQNGQTLGEAAVRIGVGR